MNFQSCFFLITRLVIFFCISIGPVHGIRGQKQNKPNLLFIITDQQRYDALHLAGNEIIKTPNLDRLAREGAYFKNAYTQCAVCAPTRASILTGHTVENHQIITNEVSNSSKNSGRMAMPTFDEILNNYGYNCEYYGKWHSPEFHTKVYNNPELTTESGKSVFARGGVARYYQDYLNKVFPKTPPKKGELYNKYLDRNYKPNPIDKHYGMTSAEVQNLEKRFPLSDLHGEALIPKEHSLTAFFAKKTIDAIERNKDIPFSITCSFNFPHGPMLPPKPYAGMYPVEEMPVPRSIKDPMENSPYYSQNGRLKNPEYADPELIKYMISDYYGLVSEIDFWVGKILNKLTELNLEENTLVIFTSDHGELLGAHGMRGKNTFYEEAARIPLLIKFPNRIPPETVVEGYVSTIDLFATINDYMGLPFHPSNGKSFRGLIEKTDTSHGEYVVTEWLYHGENAPGYMIVKGNWKMFIPYSKESKVTDVLYNLEEDPYEMNNLLGNNKDKLKYREKVKELKKDLLSWLQENNSSHYAGVKSRIII